ncbi:hypothetical protein ABEB36_006967 [Hypothenemus hampei]|uniref:Peptidase S1 domain-containing protein n=1 Tax=Hypothenemus hampei TaxID=57062 RepID=A0ABD1ESB0_HYPHA
MYTILLVFNPNYGWIDLEPRALYIEPVAAVPKRSQNLQISGGDVATPNAYSYQVGLIIGTSSFCGGSIISEQWILTSAHCTEGSITLQVIAGAHDRTNTQEATQIRVLTNDSFRHSQYDPAEIQYNVALVKVSQLPVGSIGISAITLAPADAENFAGKTGYLTGWGIYDTSYVLATELRVVQVPIITNELCKTTWNNLITDQQICISGQGAVGACNSDAGDPLVVDGIQVGLVSFESSVCGSGLPSVFSRVSFFREWITETSGV